MIPQDLAPAVLEGDVIDLLRTLPGDSIHCVVTSPPVPGGSATTVSDRSGGAGRRGVNTNGNRPDHYAVMARTASPAT